MPLCLAIALVISLKKHIALHNITAAATLGEVDLIRLLLQNERYPGNLWYMSCAFSHPLVVAVAENQVVMTGFIISRFEDLHSV